MTDVGQPEHKVQERVIKLLADRLGYRYLGNWEYRSGNANVEVELLKQHLKGRGYADTLITKAIAKLRSDASLGGGRGLYDANREVYDPASLRAPTRALARWPRPSTSLTGTSPSTTLRHRRGGHRRRQTHQAP